MYNCDIDRGFTYLCEIGDNSVLSQVSILTHDASMKKDLNMVKLVNVIIGKNCFIGFETLVMTGVTIGDNSVITARSAVVKDIPPNVLVAGSPAKIIKTLDEYHEKLKNNVFEQPIFLHPDYFNTSKSDVFKTLKKKKIGYSTIDKEKLKNILNSLYYFVVI